MKQKKNSKYYLEHMKLRTNMIIDKSLL